MAYTLSLGDVGVFKDWLGFEVSAFHDNFNDETPVDYSRTGFGVDALFLPRMRHHYALYGLLGVGGLVERLPNEKAVSYFNTGFGVILPLDRNYSLRAEARWIFNAEENRQDGRWTIGVQRSLFEGRVARSNTQRSRRPALPRYTEPASRAKAPCKEDQCPLTRAKHSPVKNPALGGLLDSVLKEVGAPSNTPVRRIEATVLYFERNQHTLSPEAAADVRRIAAILKNHPGWKLAVTGHADGRMDDVHNLQLSARRAESARRALIEQGIRDRRVQAHAKGEGSPVASNSTAEGRAKNRRVTFHVIP